MTAGLRVPRVLRVNPAEPRLRARMEWPLDDARRAQNAARTPSVSERPGSTVTSSGSPSWRSSRLPPESEIVAPRHAAIDRRASSRVTPSYVRQYARSAVPTGDVGVVGVAGFPGLPGFPGCAGVVPTR